MVVVVFGLLNVTVDIPNNHVTAEVTEPPSGVKIKKARGLTLAPL